MEKIQRDLPEGEEATHEMVMDRYYEESDAFFDTLKENS